MPQTPRFIITLVVATLAICTVMYMSVLAYCVISGSPIQADVMREFSTAGMFLLGIFCGLLSKTSSNPEPSATSQRTVTETTTTDPPSKPNEP